ncbi:uncharacterized protein SAPINGB_P004621 [Magnusiomyces paraingens]|uniref:NAD(P)-binding protein n=1 Tax=Magnusiomyces paraingens TaxID=2606893 RepID=A0A5E8C0Y7_9ASCO|nr:uncharacterized protein SAPINGB_P004621 [Saprochaete ingens]VVT55487.1 unnamed protein product [Saprochaete ingens]
MSSSPVIIVTGASRGIGASIVEQLMAAPEQPRVVGVSRSSAGLEALEKKYPERFTYVTGDVAKDSTSDAIISRALEKFGRIDGVICNAGVLEPIAPVAKASLEDWKKLYDINFFAPVSLSSKAIPELRKTHGRIVFVSSDASTIFFNGWAAYGSSKAAINHYAGSIAAEEKDIFAIAIAPGIVDTNMQNNIRDNFGEGMSSDEHKFFHELHNTGKLLPPQIPAAVVANLSLRGSGDINGKYLSYDAETLASYQLQK